MIISKVTFSSGNDFTAVIGCEHCGEYTTLRYGYDDAFYHAHVIPSIKCPYCGLDTRGRSSGVDDGVNGIEVLREPHLHSLDQKTPWGSKYCSTCAKIAGSQ